MQSILETLQYRTEHNPDKLLYAFLDITGNIKQSYTYKEFLHRTNDIASHIHRSCSLKAGDRILLAYPPGLEMVCAFFACVRLGLIPVPVYPPTTLGFKDALRKMTFIAQDCGAKTILSTRSYYWSMKLHLKRNSIATFSFKANPVSRLNWIVSNDADTNGVANFTEGHSDILFLQYTSGSTNNPKGVMVTHENIIHNCSIVVDHTPIGVSWLPQYHDMGLIGYYIFFALKGGTTYGFSPIDFIQRPALWLETISQYAGTASSAPNFAYDYCLRPDKIPEKTFENLDLSSLQFLMTAAEPVRPSTYQDFITKFEPYGLNPKSFFSAYGLAEHTLAVSNYGRSIKSFNSKSLSENEAKLLNSYELGANSTSLVSCGKPLSNTEIKIVDITGVPKEVNAGKVGEIWINGPSKCKGYWQRHDLNKEIFEAKLDGLPSSKTWLRSGDLGFVSEGELYVCGRTKDLVIIRGNNYYPQDVEFIVQREAGIRKGCVAAFSVNKNGRENLVVVAEIKSFKKPPDAQSINKNIFQYLGISADLIIYIPARTIPKTSSGKIVRHQTKKLMLANKLKVISQEQMDLNAFPNEETEAASNIDKSKDRGQDEIREFFNSHGLAGNESETFGSMGFDSLKLVEIYHELSTYLEAKGHNDLSRAIDLGLLQKIAISELFDILKGLRTLAPHSKFLFRKMFTDLQQEHKTAEQEMMKRDVASTNNVPLKPVQVGANHSKGGIFVTGGTGFFGPFLLKSLLQQNKENIYVLVRGVDPGTGMNRLRKAFASIGPTKSLQDDFDKRIKPICGDLSRPKLGINEDMWAFLANNIHTIYHNGAQVNYLLSYESMRDINIGGTNEIVSLACDSRAKILNHISTTFIFGWSVKETLFESDTNNNIDLLDFGYSQSKWVSEQIVKNSKSLGVNARIFRPALISPSIGGMGYNFDISIRLLAFMLKYGVGTSAKNQVSFTPADIAANNIVAISNIEESVGETFHVTRDSYSSMTDVTNILSTLTGKNFKNFHLKDFVPEVVSRCKKDDLLFPLLDFLLGSVSNIGAMEFKRYDNSNYRKYCKRSIWWKKDPPLEDVVSGIFRFMRGQGIVNDCIGDKSHV